MSRLPCRYANDLAALSGLNATGAEISFRLQRRHVLAPNDMAALDVLAEICGVLHDMGWDTGVHALQMAES